jgi:hypothetical protein
MLVIFYKVVNYCKEECNEKTVTKRNFFNFLQLFFDLLVICFSYFILIHLKNFFGKTYSSPNIVVSKIIFPYVLIIYLILFVIYCLYEVDGVDF